MNITRSQLAAQYKRAVSLRWIPHFEEAVEIHTKGFFDVADLLAIGSRETNLDPKYLSKSGDKGNGFGLLQIDKRSFPDWTRTGNWKDAREGILKGAEVLMQKWTDVQNSIGVKRGVRSSKTGKTSYFVGSGVSGREAQAVTIASYNAGRWAHYAVSNKKDVDTYTTGDDYSADVMQRAAVLRSLLKKDLTNSAQAAPAILPPATVVEPEFGSTILPSENPTTAFSESASPNFDAHSEQAEMGINEEIKTKTETVTPTGTASVEISKSDKNEQDVNKKALVNGGLPYNGIGFIETIKGDVKKIGIGNFGFQGLEAYIEKASGAPEWIVALVTKLALIALIISAVWVIFRLVHFAIDRWQNNERVKTEAIAATSIDKKDIQWA